jgi:hypothetical protein
VPGVQRAHCLAPRAQPGREDEPSPGEIITACCPSELTDRQVRPERLALSAELKQSVEGYLNARRLIGTRLQVAPQYIWVSVEAKVRPA